MIEPVPLLADLPDVAPDAPSVISTFSGGGGSSCGLRMAGFRVVAASEFVPEAADTYRANFPSTPLLTKDIRDTTGRDFLDAAGVDVVDVLEGSPPCSAFSMAGKREDGWGKVANYSGTTQIVDDLFFELVRLASEIRPRVVVAENVAGLTKGKAAGYLREFLRAFRKAGYVPEARVVDCSWLGIPQTRTRLVILAVRDDIAGAGVLPSFPAPYPQRATLAEAIALPDVPQRYGPIYDPETGEDISLVPRYAVGREWEKLRPGQQSARYFQLVRSHPKKPVGTMTATAGQVGAASVTHPTEPRKFTVPEVRTLCSFPPDFILTGTYAQRVERLGRAVPPILYREIGRHIRRMLEAADQEGILP